MALLAPLPAVAQAGSHHALPDVMPGDRLLVAHRAPSGAFGLHTVNWDASDRTVLPAGGVTAAWSPDGRSIAYADTSPTATAIDVVSADGATASTRVADPGISPSWSPDSTRLVYSTAAVWGPLHITTLDGDATPVPGTAGALQPVWSPSGGWIAYITRTHDLVVVRPDGSDRRVVAARAFEHAWSPDSSQLTYVTGDAGGFESRLMTVRRDGTGGRLLADFDRAMHPTFSPSGRDVAVSAATPGGSLDIWRVDLTDGSAHRLTHSTRDDVRPVWTAGGGTLAFTRSEDFDDGDLRLPTDVWRVDSLGHQARPITDTGLDQVVAFAPGRTLRLAGADRVHTAVALSATFASADTVVIARADDHPDALAGGPLASALDAPVLLTGREGLHPAVRAELARLGAGRAYLLGGTAALSPQVEADLAAAGVTDVTRLAGADRFATAAVIADELRGLAGVPDRVFVVEGHHPDPRRGWPDALSAAGVASLAGEPILLVTRDAVPQETVAAVQASGADRAVIVGGSAAVSQAVEAVLATHVGDIERVAGADRYATSAKAADLAVAAGGDAAYPWLATGRNWPDALAAASAVTRDGGVLLLVGGDTWQLPIDVDVWLTRGDDNAVLRTVIVGGSAAIAPAARTAIENAVIPVP